MSCIRGGKGEVGPSINLVVVVVVSYYYYCYITIYYCYFRYAIIILIILIKTFSDILRTSRNKVPVSYWEPYTMTFS